MTPTFSDQRAAELALMLAVSIVGAGLPPARLGPVGAIAPDGKPYREVTSFGRGIIGHDTPDAAIAEWRRRLKVYSQGHDGNRLWWREPPEISGDVRSGKGWRVYSRLRIGWETGA